MEGSTIVEFEVKILGSWVIDGKDNFLMLSIISKLIILFGVQT